MRSAAVVLTAVLALLVAVGVAVAATTIEQRERLWQLSEVGADGRSLLLGYAGGCGPDDGRPGVVETSERISIVVLKSVSVGAPCPAVLTLARLRVRARLSAPVAGRRIVGGSPFLTRPARRVPNLIGLDRRDALKALRVGGLKGRTVSRRRSGAVLRQTPRPGTPIGRADRSPPVVELRVGPPES